MGFATYWAKKLRSNPWLKNAVPFRIKPDAFKTELQKAYDEGNKDGMKAMKKLADLATGGEIDALRKHIKSD